MHGSINLQDFCERLAGAAAEEILPRFRRISDVTNKDLAAFDPVTEADRGAERIMRAMIAESFPDDGIDGEEFGAERTDAEHVWILDPIDGTRAFIIGLPIWGVLIGRTRNGRPQVGMMDQPFVGESFYGDGETAVHRHGGETVRLHTRDCEKLGDATMLTTSSALFSGRERDAFDAVNEAARTTRFGTDCYGYCMLAAGLADVVLEASLKTQDIVPLIPIIEGAGGIVTSWDGGDAAKGGRVVACGDRRLHAEMLEILAKTAG